MSEDPLRISELPELGDIPLDEEDWLVAVRTGDTFESPTGRTVKIGAHQAYSFFVRRVSGTRLLFMVPYDADTGWPTRPSVAEADAILWFSDIPGVQPPEDAESQDMVTIVIDPASIVLMGPASGPRPPDHPGVTIFPANNPNALEGDYVWEDD